MAKLITSYKELLAQREAERAAAAEIKALPILIGTEKQVNWATDIRAKKFEALNDMVANMATTDAKLRQQNQIAIQAAKNVLGSKTESRFWIDNRNVAANRLIAANNMQGELKAEFEKLTAAEASATEILSTPTVTTEAQEIAVAAESELATATNTADNTINIDDATYRTILLHAEKISNGQKSFGAVLKNELRNLLNVDASELVEAISLDSNFNRVRCYLADFPIIITNDEGTRYHLVKLTDDYCELDIINDESEPPIEKEENTMTTMTDADKAIAERKTMTRRELFLEAKKEVGYKLNARGAKMWYISYPRYDIHTGEYVGHTPALKRTRKDVEIYLRDDYCGLTVDDFLAEQAAWIDEETTKAINQMNIDDQAEHFADKVVREAKACDDNNDVFGLLPELDELNDVSEAVAVKEEIINAYGKTFGFINIGGERVSFIDGEVHVISSDKYNAHSNRQTGKYVVAIVEDGNYKAKTLDTDEEFFAEMAKRGACTCTVDEPEPPAGTDKPVDDYDSKRQERIAHHQLVSKWNAELADLKAGLSKMIGKHQKRGVLGTYKFEFGGLYVTTTNDECKYCFKVAGLPIATYDAPAQVEQVIDILGEAIARGETKFTFPAVDELNQPPMGKRALV